METPPPISFARGAPSLDIVAVDELRAAADRAFQRDPAGMCAYGTSPGYTRLLEWLSKQYGVEPDHLVATNGSMQADAFLFNQLVEPGDVVVVEAPTYDRTLLALRKLGAEILAIPLEADGIDVDALAGELEAGARPKLAHSIPNFQNPAGCTLSLEKRWRPAASSCSGRRICIRLWPAAGTRGAPATMSWDLAFTPRIGCRASTDLKERSGLTSNATRISMSAPAGFNKP